MGRVTPGFNQVVSMELHGTVIKTKLGTHVAQVLVGPLDPTAAGNLLAASAEMLEALKECLQEDWGGLAPKTVHRAMEAVAKAEGRQS